MNDAHELMERLQQDGAARFAGTRLASDHGGVTRRVRRDRAVRTSLVAVTSVAAVGGVAFAATHLNQAGPVTPATVNPATPTPSASETPATVTMSVVMQERIEDIAAALEAAVGSPGDDAMAALKNALPPEADGNPEGWVLAGDYSFDEGENLQAAAVQMVTTMTDHLESYGVPREQWHDTVILASILEQEAPAGPADQAGVARVILNRLDAGMMLQIESPLAYYLHADTEVISDDGWAVDTPYNTYMYKGLPPTAIGAFTPEALDSAVKPNDGDWMYFLRKPTDNRVLVFSTFDEYAVAVDEYYPGTGASE